MKDWVKYLIVAIAVILIVKACESEPETIIKTETKIVTVHDTIKTVEISEPKTVYVTRVKDSLIYLPNNNEGGLIGGLNDSIIKANQYNTDLKSNNATASLTITTTGALLDVSGVITYPEKETTTTITKIKDKSGLFLYGSVPVNHNMVNVEAGLVYQFKNKMMVMGGVQYNQFTKSPDIKIGVGIKIF